MGAVGVTNVRVLNNPCPLNAPFLFEIHFEAQQALQHDVEWRVVYVGSGGHNNTSSWLRQDKVNSRTDAAPTSAEFNMQADDEEITGPSPRGNKKPSSRGVDYILDSILLGPIEQGALAFEFAVNAPDFTQMDPSSVEGMQAVLVCGLYRGDEFVRIGYYLNNAYSDAALRESPPEVPLYDRLVRCIVDAPRVTRFPVEWEDDEGFYLHESNASELERPEQRRVTAERKMEARGGAADLPSDIGNEKAPAAFAGRGEMEVDNN